MFALSSLDEMFSDAPSSASFSAISLELSVLVPRRISAAVASDTPLRSGGLRRSPAGRVMRSEMLGTRWLSTTSSFMPLGSWRSTGRGSFTFSTSFDTGIRFSRTTPASVWGCAC